MVEEKKEAVELVEEKKEFYVCQLEHDEALLVYLLEELMQVEYSRVELSRAE